MRLTFASRSCCLSCGLTCGGVWPVSVWYNLAATLSPRNQKAKSTRHSFATPTIVCGAAGVELQSSVIVRNMDNARVITRCTNLGDDMRELLQCWERPSKPQSLAR